MVEYRKWTPFRHLTLFEIKDGEKKDGEIKDGEKKDGENEDGEKKDGGNKDGEI